MRFSYEILNDIKKCNDNNQINEYIEELNSNYEYLNSYSLDEIKNMINDCHLNNNIDTYKDLNKILSLKREYNSNSNIIINIINNGYKRYDKKKIVKRSFKTILIVGFSLGLFFTTKKSIELFNNTKNKINNYLESFMPKDDKEDNTNYNKINYNINQFSLLDKYYTDELGIKINGKIKKISFNDSLDMLDEKMNILKNNDYLNKKESELVLVNDKDVIKSLKFINNNGIDLNKSITNRIFKSILNVNDDKNLMYNVSNDDNSSIKVLKNGKTVDIFYISQKGTSLENIMSNYNETDNLKAIKTLYKEYNNLLNEDYYISSNDKGKIIYVSKKNNINNSKKAYIKIKK